MKRILLFCICIVLLTCTACSKQYDPYAKFKDKDLNLKSGGKELFWFSGIHNNNPEHEMFDNIKEKFMSFKADFVLVEGNFNNNIYTSEIDAKLKGESAYVTYLSNENNIEIGSIEPTFEKQTQLLLETYKEDDILAMYILRQIYQIQREDQYVDINFFEYMTSHVEGWITKDFTYCSKNVDSDFIVRILEPHIKMKIDNENWKQVDANSIDYRNKGIINSIYTDVLNYRDEYSINLISDKLKDHNRIFIMMGADHIKVQEKELRKLFDEM